VEGVGNLFLVSIKNGFITVLRKSTGPRGSQTVQVLLLMLSRLNRPD
jgi:hypothetical protein